MGHYNCSGDLTASCFSSHLATDRCGADRECFGSVKWFNVDKGFGFVAADRGGKDVFVHATALDRSGLSELPEGQCVRMQISQWQKGPEARLIKLWTNPIAAVAHTSAFARLVLKSPALYVS